MTDNAAVLLYKRDPILDPDKVLELRKNGKPIDPTQIGRYVQRKKTMWQKWVRGSAWWASLVPFFVTLAINTGELLLFDFVLEEHYPSLFPVDPFYLNWLGVVLGFALAFYASIERDLWSDYITQIQGIADDCVTLSWQVTEFVNAKKLHDEVYDAYIYEALYKPKLGETRKLYEIMREINILIRVYPMAVELDTAIRKGDRVPPVDEADWPNNLDADSLAALNMPSHLVFELGSYLLPNTIDPLDTVPVSAISDQLLHMIGLRLHLLLKQPTVERGPERKDVAREFFGPNLFAGIDQQIRGITSRSSALHSNRIVSTNPIIKGLLISCTVLYVILVPLIPWASYRWWTLAVAPVFQWVLLAFLFAGLVLEYQFVSYNKSNYVHVDTRQIAMNTAYSVDRVFDAYYRIGGFEHVPTPFTIRTRLPLDSRDFP